MALTTTRARVRARARDLALAALATGAALGGLAVTAQAAPPRLSAPLAPCTYEGAAPGARCGEIAVPLDRAHPGRGTTRVRFALVPRRDQSQPSLGTVVPNPGGPGAPATRFVDYATLLSPLLERRELLLVDPRGVGQSDPLRCRALTDPAAGLSHARLVAAFGACGRQLGARAGQYGSAAVADDLDDVRAALGLGRLDLWGDSYGTYLMAVYAARHPAHVRSAVLSGAYPIAFDTFGRDRLSGALRAIGLICSRTRSCDGRVVMRDLARVAARLRRHPVPISVRTGARSFRARLDEATLATIVYADGKEARSAALPSALASAAAGDLAQLKRLAVEVKRDLAGLMLNEAFSAPAAAAVMCHDYPTAYRNADPVPARRAALARALRALGPAAFGPFSAAGWTSAGFEGGDLCIRWPRDRTAGSPVARRALPDVPVLVLGGDLDANTPTIAGRQAAAQFRRGIYAEIANSGHTPSGDACGLGLAIGFVETLRANARACTRTGTPPQVPGRAPLRAAQLAPARADAPAEVLRALGLVGATVEDLVDQFGPIRGWGAADGLRGGFYALSATVPGAAELTGVQVVRDARVSGTLALNERRQFAGRLDISGPGVPSGTLEVEVTVGTGAGHARGQLGGRAVDVDFQPGGTR
jgi:pimeloyl-ACP methyl ester carboxylesterase